MQHRIRFQLLSDSIYEELRRSILAGVRAPGERLVELELAREFGTSQSPVRDALQRLDQDGLATKVVHKGTWVTSLTEEEMNDAWELRMMLEDVALRRAVLKMTPEGMQQLSQAIEEMRKAAGEEDVIAFADADIRFHVTVCSIAGTSILQSLWSHVNAVSRLVLATWGSAYRGSLLQVMAGHETVLEAMKRGDIEGATEENRLSLSERVKPLRERGIGERLPYSVESSMGFDSAVLEAEGGDHGKND